MDREDVELRNATYRAFVDLGRAPMAAEVAASTSLDADDVHEGWRRLHDAHALVLDATGELRMANPFSAVATPFRVQAAGRSWYANCAWDAFGIGASLRVDCWIECECADCGDPIRIHVRDRRPDDEALVFHVLVPARSWWQDIGFT